MLSAEDIATVEEALQEIQGAAPPTDRGPMGCVLALPAFLVLLVFPLAARLFSPPSWLATAVISAAIVLLMLGLALWFTAGGFVRGHAIAAAEAALRTLESWRPEIGNRDEALRACTLLLMNALASYGPTTAETFRADEARRRIAHMMPLVEAVERLLLEREVIYPVFTEP